MGFDKIDKTSRNVAQEKIFFDVNNVRKFLEEVNVFYRINCYKINFRYLYFLLNSVTKAVILTVIPQMFLFYILECHREHFSCHFYAENIFKELMVHVINVHIIIE